MEGTLLCSFIRATSLRRWLCRADCLPVIQECKVLFNKAYAPELDGYTPSTNPSVSSGETSQAVPVPVNRRHLVNQPKVILQAQHVCDRMVYAKSSTHLGNSLVHFYVDGNRATQPVTSCIKYIFVSDDRIHFAIECQLPLPHGSPNPFKHYPHFPASLYSVELSPTLETIQVNWVTSHFCSMDIVS